MRRMYSKPQLLEAVEQEAEVNGLKAFENIVDKDGHKRFIEGDLEVATISGITSVYAKWSLSGSHLLLVFCFEIDANTSITDNTAYANANLPQWILDKIYPITYNIVARQNFVVFNEGGTMTSSVATLRKQTAYISINQYASLSPTEDKICRIAFDLLIDNE